MIPIHFQNILAEADEVQKTSGAFFTYSLTTMNQDFCP